MSTKLSTILNSWYIRPSVSLHPTGLISIHQSEVSEASASPTVSDRRSGLRGASKVGSAVPLRNMAVEGCSSQARVRMARTCV